MKNNSLDVFTDRKNIGGFNALQGPSFKKLCKDIQDVTDLEESRAVFAEIIKRDIHPNQKITLSRLLLSRDFGNKTLFNMELANRIRKWIVRWNTHAAAAQFMEDRGPFNYALTIRFQRNYSSNQCRRLVKRYFRYFQKLLSPQSPVRGFGVCEPDTLPYFRDASFHIHCGLFITSKRGASELRDIALAAARMTLDDRGRPAIRVPHITKFGRRSNARELHFVEIYDEVGWILYCTKKSEGDPDFLSAHGFSIERSKVSFLHEKP